MANDRRFVRVYIDMEVEVVDPVSMKAYLFDFGKTADGELGMIDVWGEDPPGAEGIGQGMNVGSVLMRTLTQALDTERTGLRFMSGGALPRLVTDDWHPEMTLPALPARRDDGTVPEL